MATRIIRTVNRTISRNVTVRIPTKTGVKVKSVPVRANVKIVTRTIKR